MADKRSSSSDSIRQAAGDAVKAGQDISKRVRDLTLEALKNRRFDREGIRETVRSVTEGVAAAAPASGAGLRQAMGQAFRGMDEALTKSVEAGEAALRQMVATGRGISDHEVKEAPLSLLVPTWVLVIASFWFGIDATNTAEVATAAAETLMRGLP